MKKRVLSIFILGLLLGLLGEMFIAGGQQNPPPQVISIFVVVNVAAVPECDVEKHPVAGAKVTLISKAPQDKGKVLAQGFTSEKGHRGDVQDAQGTVRIGRLPLPGEAESGALGGVGAVGLCVGGSDPLGQATAGKEAELGRSSARVGMELDLAGFGGERVAGCPGEIDPVGLAVPLPHLRPQAGRGGYLDSV